MQTESRSMPNHLLRRHFIGGSEDRTIMGDDEGALLRLWREKRGELEPQGLSSDLLVQLGLAAKDLNRCWYQANGGQALTEIEWMAGTASATAIDIIKFSDAAGNDPLIDPLLRRARGGIGQGGK
jgi:hypothetical protein